MATNTSAGVRVRDFLDELDDIAEGVLVTSSSISAPEPALAELLCTTEQDVAELATKGYSIEDIALRLVLPKSAIKSLLKQKNVQDAVAQNRETLEDLRLAKLTGWFEDVMDDRMAEAKSAGTSTNKDSLSVAKAYGDLLMQSKKARKPEAETNVYLNILSQVI